MLRKLSSSYLAFSITLHCCVICLVSTADTVENGDGNKCMADRMRDLANANVPYSNDIICKYEQNFLNCISSTLKPKSTFNIIQHLLSCTRLRLMKAYNFCQLEEYNCDFPEELTNLQGEKRFIFPEFEMMDFGRIHLEGCLRLFTYMQRYSIHPCTETAISSLCMKPLIKGLGLFDANNKYFSSYEEEFTCNCAEIAQNLCNDAKLCPHDIFNRDWKAFLGKKEEIKLLNLDEYGKCFWPKQEKDKYNVDECTKLDFNAVGKCLQKRYFSYVDVQFDNVKQPFKLHCDIETELDNCLAEESKSETEKKCVNKNDFIIWTRIQAYITIKVLEMSKMCPVTQSSILFSQKISSKITDVMIEGIQVMGSRLATPCGIKALETCYYVRSYMHKFLVHPCIEWMMFYRCVRDNLMVCQEYIAAEYITRFLEGRLSISINKGNQWNHAECEILNKMSYDNSKKNIITMNRVNPFKKNIDI